MSVQGTWGLLDSDSDTHHTVVAVGIAKLSEPAVVTQQKSHGSFAGTGRALSVAAGRLSYIHGLKARSHHSAFQDVLPLASTVQHCTMTLQRPVLACVLYVLKVL